MAHIQPEQTATIGCGVTPPRAERARSSIKNAEEAPRHLSSLLAESAWLMSIKKPGKTSPALGSPFLRRDSLLYTTNRNAHSIANAEEHALGIISQNRAGRHLCTKNATPLFQRSNVILVLIMQTTCRARLAQHVVEVRNRVFQTAQSGSGKANPKSHMLPGFPRGRSEHQPCRRALRRHSPLEPSCAGTRSWTARGVHNPRAS